MIIGCRCSWIIQKNIMLASKSQGNSTSVIQLTVTTASVAVVSLFLYNKWKKQQQKSSRDPNLPPQCNILSSMEMIKMFNSPSAPSEILKLRNEFGHADFQFPDLPFGFPPMYILTDHRSARKALEDTKSSKYERTNQFFVRTTHNGTNMIVAEGHRWKHVRKSTSTAFSAENLKRMIEPIDKILDQWILDTLEPSIKNNSSFDILNELNQITANVIANVAFDYEFEPGEREQFLKDLNTCWREFGVESNMNILMQLPFTAWMYPGIWRGKFAAKRMFHFCQKMLDAYKSKDPASHKDYKLIHMIMNDDEYENDGERCRDMIGYTIAGFDTTANTLSFALRELAMNKDLQTKLRNELNKCSNADEARNCPELKRVMKETLRMYPAAAMGSVRQLGNDLTLSTTKNIIPKGSIVITNYYSMQRDPELFEDPETFKPSRWEEPTKEQTMSILTFSVGRRSCQGQGLATTEMNEILYRLISKYNFDIVEKGEAHNVLLFKPVGTLLSATIASN